MTFIGAAALQAAAPTADASCARGTSQLDTGRIDAVIAAVSSAVDDRLRVSWQVPIEAPPAWLALEVARITHYELCGEAAVTDQIRRRARAAWRRIDMLAQGGVQLDRADADGDGRPNAESGSGRAVITGTPVRHFGLGDTRGII